MDTVCGCCVSRVVEEGKKASSEVARVRAAFKLRGDECWRCNHDAAGGLLLARALARTCVVDSGQAHLLPAFIKPSDLPPSSTFPPSSSIHDHCHPSRPALPPHLNHHYNPFPTPKPTQNRKNDWRQIRRQGQRHQVQRAIVSLSSKHARPSQSHLPSASGAFDALFSSHLTRFSHHNNPFLRSQTDFKSQPFFQGRSRIPSRSCPPSAPQGQLRSACRCW